VRREGVVERGDRGDEVQRLAHRVDAARAPLGGDVAGEDLGIVLQRAHRREAQHIDGAAHLVGGVGEAEAGLGGDEEAGFVDALQQRVGHGVEDAGALVPAQRGFGGAGALDHGGGGGGVDRADPADEGAVVGVADFDPLPAFLLAPSDEAAVFVECGVGAHASSMPLQR